MNRKNQKTKLKLLPYNQYGGVDEKDPIRFYYWPVIGSVYRRRVEMCLEKCQGGERILEVGFGTGLSFLNLKDLYRDIYGLDLTANIPQVLATFADQNINLNLQNGNVLKMDFPDQFFDTVLLVSILEHLQPAEQTQAFSEIRRVLKPGGQVIYGTPVERTFMVTMFRMMGVNIRDHHYSTHEEIAAAAKAIFHQGVIEYLRAPVIGNIYQVGQFQRT